jgi:hypothetical protein
VVGYMLTLGDSLATITLTLTLTLTHPHPHPHEHSAFRKPFPWEMRARLRKPFPWEFCVERLVPDVEKSRVSESGNARVGSQRR